MNPYLKYLAYVIKHKRFVFQEGRKLGLSRWQLFKHDLHKLRGDEFIPYAEYFNADGSREAFNRAWLLHQRRSSHHWQAHVLLLDDGGFQALEMPPKDRLEMIADWRGAGRAIYGFDDTAGWYRKNMRNMLLHPATRLAVEAELGLLRNA